MEKQENDCIFPQAPLGVLASLASPPRLPPGPSHPSPAGLGTLRTGLPGIRSLQVGGLHRPRRKGAEDEAHVFVGQRQRSLGPPCEKKSTRLGVSRRRLCRSRLQTLALPEKYSLVTHFPSQKTFCHRWSRQTSLVRTRVCFLRRGAHFSPLSVLHLKSPRQILVNASHGPAGTPPAEPLPAPHLPSGKQVDLGREQFLERLPMPWGCGQVPSGQGPLPAGQSPETHASSRAAHSPPRSTSSQHLSADPTSLRPPARSGEGDGPRCSAFLSLLEFQPSTT